MSGRAYIRHKQGVPPEGATQYDALPAGHPSYHDKCPVCGHILGDGKPVRLRANPVLRQLDAEESYKYKANQWFTCPAEIIHDACATQRAAVSHGKTVTVVKT